MTRCSPAAIAPLRDGHHVSSLPDHKAKILSPLRIESMFAELGCEEALSLSRAKVKPESLTNRQSEVIALDLTEELLEKPLQALPNVCLPGESPLEALDRCGICRGIQRPMLLRPGSFDDAVIAQESINDRVIFVVGATGDRRDCASNRAQRARQPCTPSSSMVCGDSGMAGRQWRTC